MPGLRILRRLTIRQKLLLTIITGTLAVIFLTSTIALYEMSGILKKDLINKGTIVATDVSKHSIEPIMHDDIWELYKFVRTMAESSHMPFLSYIMILDADGTVLAHSNPHIYRVGDQVLESPLDKNALLATGAVVQVVPISKDENLYDISVPCYLEKQKLGIVRVGLTDRVMKKDLAVIKQNILVLAVFLSLISIAVGIFMAHRITAPLSKITQNIIKISRGKLGDVIPIETSEMDEIGHLTDVFNEMAKNLRTQKEMDEHLAKKERLAMIGELAVNIAHEVKNPLTGIKLGIDTLRRDGSGEDIIERVDREITRLDRVTSKLLSFTHASSPVLEKTEIRQTVEEAVFFTAKVAEKKGIKIYCQTIEQDVFVKLDKDQIQQAFLNIILNAIHATGRGGNIYLSASKNGTTAKVFIKDTGSGIKPDDMARIFEPFYSTNPMSSGLGLAIAHRIITAHNGDINVESRIGEGTVVTITLPVIIEGS